MLGSQTSSLIPITSHSKKRPSWVENIRKDTIMGAEVKKGARSGVGSTVTQRISVCLSVDKVVTEIQTATQTTLQATMDTDITRPREMESGVDLGPMRGF